MTRRLLLSVSTALLLGSAAVAAPPSSTRAQREASFDEILAKTLDRESFSRVKNERLGLDVQFAAMVIDNDLGHTIDMPAGGYSSTWEWEEVLVLPGTDRSLARYMWSIGHTIRPNGGILEGNPADVREPVPLTRDTFETGHGGLLERAYRYMGLGADIP